MHATLDSAASVPLYQQIVEGIRRDIAAERYLPGQRVPTEIELVDTYHVSRDTVRKAVKELEKQGLLTKRRGKGTFVNEIRDEKGLFDGGLVQGFTEMCRENGSMPGAELITREIITVFGRDASFFGSGAPRQVIRIKRIRTADGEPLMVEDNLFKLSPYRFLLDAELADTSIFKLIEEHTGFVPQSPDGFTLSMGHAPGDIAELLRVPVDEPLFLATGRYRDQNGGPMFIGTQHIVGKRYRFHL